ncbi:glutamyl-tRNA reductase [Hyalangium rubrum]|uniref:Glutamyl-tRNA reductase n=1 Tax=Hyalangium rubrum TaxID=3103134 RepID=A0ABU5HHC8_9BACT|nr:glutamyl-tRNA reductase [Hyalangium sp. s54d21]MDY7231490.1 glutamyl-tRNA reductase [Hyalangium sp. s54d21]
MELVCVGLSHRTAPLAVRERLALTEVDRAGLLQQWGQAPGEAMLVVTCNRVEVYVATPDAVGARARVREALGRLGGPEVLEHLYEHQGTTALEHLFRVAASLDSLVLGEAQILGQLKAAFAQARQAGAARGGLTRICAAAFSCAKRVRTETAIGQAATSMASAAVALATQAFGTLSDKTVLVVGAGEMGQLAARHVKQARPGRLLITNRTQARAEALAAEVGGTARPFEELHLLLKEADVVVCSTASPLPLFTRENVGAAGALRPLLMLDLAVPRDISPDVAELAGVRTYNVDDIQAFVAENEAARAEEARRAHGLILEEVARFSRERAVRDGVPVLARLRQQAEQIARAESERTLVALGEGLTDKQRKSVEAMARAIVNKLLHEPTACLRSGAEGEEGQLLAETAARLFGLLGEAPR